jgi:hypothetical protein
MTFKFGLSTWVATMERPVPGNHLGGRVKANNEDWFLDDDEKRYETRGRGYLVK